MELFENIEKKIKAKPFIKWAGGKSQLLTKFEEYYPKELKVGLIENYFEPFLGGAAVYFDIIQKYDLKRSFLFDNNPELVILYNAVKENVELLIDKLTELKNQYLLLNDKEREEFFYAIRDAFNLQKENVKAHKVDNFSVKRAAQIIFLNKTCFNGLFRVNRKGDFNVPFGRYKTPGIFDESNLREVSHYLQNAEIKNCDYSELNGNVNSKSFIYFDPPYRPLNITSNFNSYSKIGFDDNEQQRLAKVFKDLDKKGAKLMLSNSDPKNHDIEDNFFDDLYHGFNVHRVEANRMINSNGAKRGKITELLITNY